MEDESYREAALLVTSFAREHPIQFKDTEEKIESCRKMFLAKYSPEALAALPDSVLLRHMFLNPDSSKDNLCYFLEFNSDIRRIFGSIAGGSSFKYTLFQKASTCKWTTGSPGNPQELTEEAALERGKEIRDLLVQGASIISSCQLNTVSDYEALDDRLNGQIGNFAAYGWVQKYFHMLFPDKFVGWFASDLLDHFLYGLGLEPSSKYYAKNGQLALVMQKTGYPSPHFLDVCYAMFGVQIKHFYRLDASVQGGHYAEEWKQSSLVALGGSESGDLSILASNGILSKSDIASVLPGANSKSANQKAAELKTFYDTDSNSIIAVTEGAHIEGLVDNLGPYYFDESSAMPHCKSGTWIEISGDLGSLPAINGGSQPSFCEIRDSNSLLYLYRKYYNLHPDETLPVPIAENKVRYQTGYASEKSRNMIFFGAPGTGKSYTLNQQKDILLADGGDYERVTFHPDCSFAGFVGTYKPVPSTDSDGRETITYAYVPGPFMRIYVKALENSKTAAPKPFLLVIEEINRANAAAVFGDVFQLLDRNDQEISEYPVQASEDIRKYLADALGGSPDDYPELILPDNMFIWATMNSADQGVFPLDTAFKRRWDFTYLGIDDSEAGIAGLKVILGEGDNARVIKWNDLRKAVNGQLLSYGVNEDKLMGPYFLSAKSLPADENGLLDRGAFCRVFKSKVIMYLFDDAARRKRSDLFSGCKADRNQYSAICREFDTRGVFIFCDEVSSQFNDRPPGDGGQ